MTKTAKRWTLFGVINGLILLAAPLYVIYTEWFVRLFPALFTECACLRFFYLYCPGCGGTRAVGALLRGDVADSFLLNPLVPIAAVLFIYYDIRAALAICRKDPLAVNPHPAVWIGFCLLILLLAVGRNIAAIYWGIDPIGVVAGYWEIG